MVFNKGLIWKELVFGMEEIFSPFTVVWICKRRWYVLQLVGNIYISEFYQKSWLAGKISRLTGRNKRFVNINTPLWGYSKFVVLCTGWKMEIKAYINKEMFKNIWLYVWKRSKKPESVLVLGFFLPASNGTIGELKYYSNSAMQAPPECAVHDEAHLLYSPKGWSCFKFFSSLCVLIVLKCNYLFLTESVHAWACSSQISSAWTVYRQLPSGCVSISILVQVRVCFFKQISHSLPLLLLLHLDSHHGAIWERTNWIAFCWK